MNGDEKQKMAIPALAPVAVKKTSKTDHIIEPVVAALSDSRYDFRTIEGISKETGLSLAEVNSAIDSLGPAVRMANVTDTDGRSLYTLSSRRKKTREIISEARAFLAGSAR